jgi:hypothetical protein
LLLVIVVVFVFIVIDVDDDIRPIVFVDKPVLLLECGTKIYTNPIKIKDKSLKKL